MIEIKGEEELRQEAVSLNGTKGPSRETDEPDQTKALSRETDEPDQTEALSRETDEPKESENLSTENTKPEEIEAPETEAVSETGADSYVKNERKEYYTSFKDEYDIEHPGLPAPFCDYFTKSGISAYAISQRGQSHIKKDIACQDRSGVRIIKDRGIVVAAIADGVGSCALSDLGAECAVDTALNTMEAELKKVSTLDKAAAGNVLRKAMSFSYDAVERMAGELMVNVYSFQSTLTAVIYDGKNLYVGHAGDDGVVALLRDGNYYLVTVRHKGQEASSVYPLQSRSTWQFGMSADVIGFVMCTDGVLDSFVGSDFEENRIYFPFIEQEFKKPALSLNDVRKTCAEREKILLSDEYRTKVTDDLTYVAIVNHSALSNLSAKPVFNKTKWDEETEKYKKMREELLKRESSIDSRKNDSFYSEENKTGDKKSYDDRGSLPEGKYKAGYTKRPLEHNKTSGKPRTGFSGHYKESGSNKEKVVEGTIQIKEGIETVTEGLFGMAGGIINEFLSDKNSPDDLNRRR